MSESSSKYYFELVDYRHALIFAGCKHVWEAIDNIQPYLQTLPQMGVDTSALPGVFLENAETIWIGKHTRIEAGAYIKGPCWIGDECVVRHGAYIRGNVITGNNCVIGHDTEIKNTILLDRSHAAHFAYLGDSILGNDVNLGAGVKCANLRFDKKEIHVQIEGVAYSTGMRKLGAIIGDKTQLGCNTVTNPGTLVGREVFSFPCTNFGGFIPSGCSVSTGTKPVILKRL